MSQPNLLSRRLARICAPANPVVAPPVRLRSLALGLALACAFIAGHASTASAQVLPAGFQDSIVFSGHAFPTAVRFSPNGEVFVAEKSGLLYVYESTLDPTPTEVIDLRASVYNYWDRGLLGVAVDPSFPTNPHVYVLYAHDTWPPGDPRFGDPTQPRWGTGEPSPSTADPCPAANPPTAEAPGGTDQGCVVYGRLSRITVNPTTYVGTETVLIEGNWCLQYPSHSVGDLAFGPDGYLYVSSGEGGSFGFADWGQFGIPVNPCGDPPDGVGGPNTGTDAEGGALRSQDVLTPNLSGTDPTTFDGAVLRLDVSTTPPTAPPDNPLVGNGVADDDPIIAVGLRNPFRITHRPGTSEVWISDVGQDTWEEVNRIVSPTVDVDDFGWPCYEGVGKLASYQSQDLCRRLYGELGPPLPAEITYRPPHWTYEHGVEIEPGDPCGTSPAGSSTTGVAFSVGTGFPAAYDDALFIADSSRQCVWVMYPDGSGDPDPSNIESFMYAAPGPPVDLRFGPDGGLYWVDHALGNIHRIDYFADNTPPVAVLSAMPTNGAAPLAVSFDASASYDAEDGSALNYAWDLDGDGVFGDAPDAPTANWIYTTAGAFLARVKVIDSQNGERTTGATITVGNSPPTATILTPAPSFTWAVGDPIDWSVEATDPQDGTLPASQVTLTVIMHHCTTETDCHAHQVTQIAGSKTGSFLAPDHEWPSHIELKLDVDDLLPSTWLDAAWGQRREILIDASAWTETLTDFPLLVRLDPSRIDYAKTSPGGADLRFADATGQSLPYEIERWTPGGESIVWVRVPNIVAGLADNRIYVYYENPVAADSQDAAAVWAGHAGVWHLDGLLDATANDNDGFDNGTSSTTGFIGDGRSFDGASYVDLGTSPSLEISSQITLEAWVKVANPAADIEGRILSKKSTWNSSYGYSFEHQPVGNNVSSLGSGIDFLRAEPADFGTAWHHVAVTQGGGLGRIYIDGVDATTDDTVSPLAQNAQPLNMGRRSGGGNYFVGVLDEVRVTEGIRSPTWIAAQYASMTDTLASFGPEETPPVLSDTASVLLYPKTVDISIESQPPGALISTLGHQDVAPFVRTAIVNSVVSVGVLSPQVVGNQLLQFASWSDGGAASHTLAAPALPATLTAFFDVAPACGDGLDNDGDGLVDAGSDPGCDDAADTSELSPALVCDDGLDNDADGLADANDPGCSSGLDASEQDPAAPCDDGADNDADALVDAADPGCAGPLDPNETDPAAVCDDGLDNDGDGGIDAADAGCDSPLDPSERSPSIACDDGLDNDGDGQIDYPADVDCASPEGLSEAAAAVPTAGAAALIGLAAGLAVSGARLAERRRDRRRPQTGL